MFTVLFYLNRCEHYDVTMTFSFRVLIVNFIPYIPCISYLHFTLLCI